MSGTLLCQVATDIRGDERPSEILAGLVDVGRAPADAVVVRTVYACVEDNLAGTTRQVAIVTFFTEDLGWAGKPIPSTSYDAARALQEEQHRFDNLWKGGVPNPRG